ncbi:amidohydrolase family protein [Nocardia nova]|uniref:2-amino-3-carboxymuconate-6-semialdehyde decarboxylase n=1 Tax=Nocardia nova TaxID=37330 RepID=A0A2S6A200_9NOCA|nr:amidohydrolase family protein [Nocardia nova]PPJ25574.1 amidohydrolase [Nocardia nova]
MDLTSTHQAPAVGVDTHAHYFGLDLADRLPGIRDPRWPALHRSGTGGGAIMLGDKVFRNVRSVLWDVDERIAELDAADIRTQLISPVPVMLAYWAHESVAVACARATNDSIAAAVARSGGRLAGLGTVPLPHVDSAVEELRRAVLDLGLAGVEIGTQISGADLDAPFLAPFFEAAESLGAAVFVHPTDGGGGVIRRGGQPYDFGLGMITDTAVAATALVFGGVLERFANLRVGLAHGCGTFPWAFPRLGLGAKIWHGADQGRAAELVRSLWVDSLVFDPAHLSLLVRRFGRGHVMLGTDYPFVPGQLEGAADFLASARDIGALDAATARDIHAANGLAFLQTPSVIASRTTISDTAGGPDD